MSIRLAKRMIENMAGRSPKSDAPIASVEGPIGKLKVGGVLDLAPAVATFVMAQSAGSLVKPPQLSSIIKAHGKTDSGPYTIHRFYINDAFLQIVTMHGLPVADEVRFFSHLAEVNPQDTFEWDLWLKGVNGNPPLLVGPSIFWDETYNFTRMWGGDASEVKPIRSVEWIDNGEYRSSLSLQSMRYGRKLGGTNRDEWLQLAVVQDDAGDTWIEAYVGLTIATGEVNAI